MVLTVIVPCPFLPPFPLKGFVNVPALTICIMCIVGSNIFVIQFDICLDMWIERSSLLYYIPLPGYTPGSQGSHHQQGKTFHCRGHTHKT